MLTHQWMVSEQHREPPFVRAPGHHWPRRFKLGRFLKLFRPISLYMKHVNFDLSDARQPELKPIFPSLALLPFFGLICAPLWLRSTS
jgi:hypothetical protein